MRKSFQCQWQSPPTHTEPLGPRTRGSTKKHDHHWVRKGLQPISIGIPRNHCSGGPSNNRMATITTTNQCQQHHFVTRAFWSALEAVQNLCDNNLRLARHVTDRFPSNVLFERWHRRRPSWQRLSLASGSKGAAQGPPPDRQENCTLEYRPQNHQSHAYPCTTTVRGGVHSLHQWHQPVTIP